MLLTLPIRALSAATPRAAIVRLALDGQELAYQSGQFVRVGRPGAVRRPYSVAIAPHESRARGELELLVGLDASGTPGPHLPPLTVGTPVEVDGPHGSFVLPHRPAERRFLFVAGGTGIAPLRAMLHEALASTPPPVVGVVYSARHPDEFAYAGELRQLASDGVVTLLQTVTRTNESAWSGARGRVAAHHLGELADADTLCFVCGPHPFVEGTIPVLTQAGVPPERIRVEDWGAD